MHAAASTNYCGEKRNVLIVSVLFPIGVDLTLCSNNVGCVRLPFCSTWLLDKNLSWAMLRSKTKLLLPA